ncbi:ABC transporter ATP-binding protein [Microbacterium sp. cx-55]|uniref:dipeptide ABC transporter ATP-binding protein n=1 Tax=Microbacterium sp. cx-55 TaxID=2875948 RepID=UPI001CBC389B|nr:ABC transporter ATP-binding protein [Microbacterium sp. cx-55]MBZ4485891.1 ABC transporter ATP-binding protein [Microbacterium sp. cx-55]UGB34233.1 ABC transporter ATP-binding protein [Microbacterium sp. cx-55]
MTDPRPATPTRTGTPLLSVRDLSVTFPQREGPAVHAVRGISYDVFPGEFLGIVGESGSGKSVSSLAIMGLLPSSAQVSGAIEFEGTSLLGLDDAKMSRVRGKGLAMVFQDPLSALTPVYTVGDQISEALRLHDGKLSAQAAAARAVELLKVVGIPDADRRARAFPHEYSGGMRQRAMIAMAIANDPQVILADEPTTALDVTIQAQILEVLETAKEITGAAVVLITHDLGVVAGHADRVGVMYAGKMVELGSTDEVFAAPHMPYSIGLLRSVPNMMTAGTQRLVPLEGRPPSLAHLPAGCPFAARCPIAIDACREVEPALVAHDPESPLHVSACIRAGEIASGELRRPEIFPRPEPLPAEERAETDGAPVVEVTDLIRHFPLMKGSVFPRRVGTVRAVDGVSFTLRPGRTLGLVGESGCGKTTTILEIMEMTAPQSGSIRIQGTDVGSATKREINALRPGVQIVFQDPMGAIDPRLPVGEVITEPLWVQGASKAERDARVTELLELVGLDPAMADRYPHEFSGGQRQRLGIARALSTNPAVLILDEPVSALDVSVQAGVINLLEDLKDRLGLSYLFVAHDLAVVRQIADDVAVMYLGRIVEQGPIAEIFHTPRHPYTKALISAAPIPDPTIERQRTRILLNGDLPSPTQEIEGCRFRTRCPLYALLDESARTRCRESDPQLAAHGRAQVACHHVDRSALVEQAALADAS